jgi:hypothetical protein
MVNMVAPAIKLFNFKTLRLKLLIQCKYRIRFTKVSWISREDINPL